MALFTGPLPAVFLGNWVWSISMVFLGCCTNVFMLEAIVREDPKAGTLITFAQFLFITIDGLVHFIDWRSSYLLSRPHIPFTRLFLIVSLFFSSSILTNYVYDFNISMPFHIIFRSGGTLVTLVLGLMFGKTFSVRQATSVLILTIGVVIATLDNMPKGSGGHKSTRRDQLRYAAGVAMLALSQVLLSTMALISEITYKTYGKHWRETMFYMHFLSLPFFGWFAPSIKNEFISLYNSATINIAFITIPRQILNLCLNVVTQYVCARGVQQLAGSASAVSVNVVLNIRKLVSLLLSIVLFGNPLKPMTVFGTILVFWGATLYVRETNRHSHRQRPKIHNNRRPLPNNATPESITGVSTPLASQDTITNNNNNNIKEEKEKEKEKSQAVDPILQVVEKLESPSKKTRRDSFSLEPKDVPAGTKLD